MMKGWMRALLCLCLLLPIGAKAEGPFSHVIVFGDSLSDTGNGAAFIDVSLLEFGIQVPIGANGLCNPVDTIFSPSPRRGCGDLFFEESRVSNGPVAVEILAERVGFDELKPSLFFLPLPDLPPVFPNFPQPPDFGTNYAVAGAEAAEFGPGDFNTQIAAFLEDHPVAPSDALYVIFIGGNDVRAARGALLPPPTGETPEEIITQALSTIQEKIGDLILAGGRIFLVVNVVDIGNLPETRRAAKTVEDLLGIPAEQTIKQTTLLTKEFNAGLAEVLRQIELDQEQMGNSIELRKFNLFALFKVIRFVGGLFGLNVVDACFNTDVYLASPTAQRIFDPDCAPDEPNGAPKFDRFLFFDDIHPTGWVHAIVGKALAAAARKLAD